MEISEILNILLSGGLVGTVAAIGSLRATVRKAKAEASRAEADAETVRVDNADHATRLLVENIVKPLKDELNATRKDLQATKREMARLRKSIDSANSCKHRDECPVLYVLREQPKDRGGERTGTDREQGQHRERNTACDRGTGPEVGGEPDPECGQPP